VNLTKEQFLLDKAVLQDFIETTGVEIIYGFDGTGWLGWLIVVEDYPSFCTLHAGVTFDEALAFVRSWAEEERAERMDEETELSGYEALLPGDDGYSFVDIDPFDEIDLDDNLL
jgi:hypothetical protein